ncbi:MAG: flagellar motor protein MotB [Candidatus Marinimicrobia bacterium]|nr:flagellar motor protein MotB [FCB group bacterium]MBL7025123.1 flagellar motor protein MotB [Candidatus Neomarinimicrobiota bacterium]
MAIEPKKKQQQDEGGWLTTYADMMTLLMTFFVLLFAMSTLDPVKLEQFGDSTKKDKGSAKKSKKVSLSQINKEVKKLVVEQELSSQVTVSMNARGVTLGIASDLAFGSGTAILSGPIKSFLVKLVSTMEKATYAIAVEGHTDNDPIRSSQFPSNWELSAARSSAVIRYLTEQGIAADKFRAIGFGDTVPLVANDTRANKAKNRRVDITFLTIG